MDCPACKARNPADARFCLQCGRPLAAACARCDAELPAEARFCPRCGTPVGGVEAPAARSRVEVYVPKELLARLDAARASGGPLGERRVVTILFSDVQGSTAAAEKVDPEEWVEIMKMQALAAVVERRTQRAKTNRSAASTSFMRSGGTRPASAGFPVRASTNRAGSSERS